MPTESPSEEKQRLVQIFEKLLDTKRALSFLMQFEQGDLERPVVASRERLERRPDVTSGYSHGIHDMDVCSSDGG